MGEECVCGWVVEPSRAVMDEEWSDDDDEGRSGRAWYYFPMWMELDL